MLHDSFQFQLLGPHGSMYFSLSSLQGTLNFSFGVPMAIYISVLGSPWQFPFLFWGSHGSLYFSFGAPMALSISVEIPFQFRDPHHGSHGKLFGFKLAFDSSHGLAMESISSWIGLWLAVLQSPGNPQGTPRNHREFPGTHRQSQRNPQEIPRES